MRFKNQKDLNYLLFSLLKIYMTRLYTLKNGLRSSLFFVYRTIVLHIRAPPFLSIRKIIERRIIVDKLPKRRKFKDNPYTLLIENNNYYIVFKDNKNELHKEKVEKEIFDVFDENERYENARLKEYSIHIEHFELSDINLYKRIQNKQQNLEDIIINSFLIKDLEFAINNLNEIQKIRIKKYYFDNKTLAQIANEENCSKVAIKYSIDIAIKNISNKLKNN